MRAYPLATHAHTHTHTYIYIYMYIYTYIWAATTDFWYLLPVEPTTDMIDPCGGFDWIGIGVALDHDQKCLKRFNKHRQPQITTHICDS